MSEIFSFDYVPNYAPSKNEGYKKGDTKREVYYYNGDKEGKDQRKGFYMYFDESEIYKYTGECKKLDNISTDDLYNELCFRMSELDEIVVLLSVEKYKSLLDLENERREFEEYKKAEMEKLVREKEREKREFEEYKKAVMDKEMEKLSIELKKEKETFVNDISIELYKYENRPAERIPEEILKRINSRGIVPSTDDLYPVLYNKNYIQSSNSPSQMYVHTFYYNTGARLDINERIGPNNYDEVNQLGHSYRSPPYLRDLYEQTVIDSLKQQYKDKYIFTQKMVDIIYKTFDGKEKFILNNHHYRWSEYVSNPSENNVDRLVNALKQERDEYILNLRTLV